MSRSDIIAWMPQGTFTSVLPGALDATAPYVKSSLNTSTPQCAKDVNPPVMKPNMEPTARVKG